LLTQGIGSGDIVVTSSMTFAATANSIVYTGADPYFIDSELESGNMDPNLLRQALTKLRDAGETVKAVLPVDLLGRAADYSAIKPICDEFELPLIADAAEALGAKHNGEPAGSFGIAAALSFNGNKIMTTSGGGALLTNDEAIATRARYLATQARQPEIWYEHKDIGYNYRLSNLLAAVGRAQLQRLDSMMARRKALRELYRELFASVPGVEIFQGAKDHEDNYWLTSIIVDEQQTGWTTEELRLFLAENGMESRPLWKPMHLQPVFSDSRGEINGTSQYLFEHGLTLPSGSSISDAERAEITDVLTDFLQHHV
jgi:dTDP-4-amino-4,6-dideoxygalactose transaminase